MNDVTNLHGPDDHETEHRLAGALQREAETIEPGSRFDAIRAEGRRGRAGKLIGVVAAAMVGAVVAGLVVGMLVQRTGMPTASDDRGGQPGPAATTAAEPGPTTESKAGSSGAPSSPASSDSSSVGTTGSETVPVYWLGPEDKLYREYLAPVEASDSRVVAAVETMLAGKPLDPDYRGGPWQAATGVTAEQQGDDLTVDLPAAAFGNDEVSEDESRQALQQLVYTATAAVQAQGTVTVLIDGQPGTAWGQVDVGEPLSRDIAARSTVWITGLQEGDTRKAGKVSIEGVATAFEGNVVWKVAREDGTVVEEGHTMAGANGEYGPYSFEVELEPGSYVITVTAPDMSGNTEGVSDSKTFTVD